MHTPEYTKQIKAALAARETLELNLNSAIYHFRQGRKPYPENLDAVREAFSELMAILEPAKETQQENKVHSSSKCFHVTTAQGEIYGVAASNKTEAMELTQRRLLGEASGDVPRRSQYVGMWEAEFGTVIHY